MQLRAGGVAIKVEQSATFRDCNGIFEDTAALRARFAADGYLLVRGLIEREVVLAARREMLLKYAIIGEIDDRNHPLMDAVPSDRSFVDRVNLLAFTESLRLGLAYREVVESSRLKGTLERVAGSGAMRSLQFKWIRFLRPAEGTAVHCDAPYVNRGTRNVYSAWIPLGDVPREGGAVYLLEGSHRLPEVIEYGWTSRDAAKPPWLEGSPNEIAEVLGGRWLSGDFQAGDVLFFDVFAVHGALDNGLATRCRLSTDVRYYPAHEPGDERWDGADCSRSGTRAFFPGLASGGAGFEWKAVDRHGRLLR